MEGSRLRILNLLVQRRQATVEQLSRDMGLASATVRRHLDILQRDNLVAYHQVKKRTGRPEHTYYLTEAGQESLPKGYNQLLGRLLQRIAGLPLQEVSYRSGEELLRMLFQEMAKETVGPNGNSSAAFEERLQRALTVLQQEQFLPEVEEVAGVLRIRLLNCPFRSVALGNSTVCEYDQDILSSILGAKVERDTCIRGGDHGCCYRVSRLSEVKV